MTQLEFGLALGEAPPPRKRPARRGPALRPEIQLDLWPRAEPPPLPDDPTSPTGLGPEALVPTLSGKVRVESVLRAYMGPKVLVKLHQNRTTMLSFKRQRGVTYARLHALFAHAPDEVLGAVADYITDPEPSDRVRHTIDRFLEANRDLVEENRATRIQLRAEGAHHDLQEIFDELDRTFFAGRLTSRITWSRAAKGQRRTTMRLGSYNESENLIRVHPALDQKFVPRYFVASVVFHEMLHEVHGAEEVAPNKRAVHTPAFLADERRFPDYARAREWERKHIKRLLRY